MESSSEVITSNRIRHGGIKHTEKETAIGICQIQNTKIKRLHSIERQTYERRRDVLAPRAVRLHSLENTKSLPLIGIKPRLSSHPARRINDGVIYTYELGDFETFED